MRLLFVRQQQRRTDRHPCAAATRHDKLPEFAAAVDVAVLVLNRRGATARFLAMLTRAPVTSMIATAALAAASPLCTASFHELDLIISAPAPVAASPPCTAYLAEWELIRSTSAPAASPVRTASFVELELITSAPAPAPSPLCTSPVVKVELVEAQLQ